MTVVFNLYIFAAQLKEIRKVKLAKIMCENLNVDPIQSDVFHIPSPRYDPYIKKNYMSQYYNEQECT